MRDLWRTSGSITSTPARFFALYGNAESSGFRFMLPAAGNFRSSTLGKRSPFPHVRAAHLRARFALFAPLLVVAVGVADLLGWRLHLPLLTSVFPGYATMKPNTAACLLLLALAALGRRGGVPALVRRAAAALALAAFALSALSLLEYATGHSLGIDNLLLSVPPEHFGDPVGRMSLGTAVSVAITSAALALLDRLPRLSTGLLLTGCLLSVSGLVGFLLQAGPLTGVLWFRSLAIHTALSLLLVQGATLLLRPDREPVLTLLGEHQPEELRRQLLLAVTALPILLAMVVLRGYHLRLYDGSFAVALLIVLLLGVQTTVLWSDNLTLSRTHAQLREREAESSRILESIGDAVIVTDAENRILRLNPVAEELTGWRRDEAIGEPLTAVFRLADLSQATPGTPVDAAHLLRRDGSAAAIDHSSAPIRAAGGGQLGQRGQLGEVLTFRDVSTREAARHALRASEDRLRLAVEAASLGSWELDLTTQRIECSPLCKASFGRDPHEPLLYADLLASIDPADRPARDQAMQAALETGADFRAEFRCHWPDGSVHWLIANGRVLRDDAGRPARVVGVTLDVTERHHAAQALLESEKLAAVGRLASSIAHEINNPLESVTNLLYLIRTTDALPAAALEFLDLADRELRRVSAITSQTLRFHKQASSPRPIRCGDLLEEILSVYQGKLVNSHVVVGMRNRERDHVACFEGEIRQVFSNLVGNAIDAMHPNGGRLELRLRDARDWRTGQRGTTVTVADTGCGMSPATLARIFQPFYTTKGFAGTGLGLWVSEQIVARHGGRLRVRSRQTPGRSGTVFALFLPELLPHGLAGTETTPTQP